MYVALFLRQMSRQALICACLVRHLLRPISVEPLAMLSALSVAAFLATRRHFCPGHALAARQGRPGSRRRN